MRLANACWLMLLAVFLASCSSPLDMSRIEVGTNNTVSWEDAQTIIRDGAVIAVTQAHSLEVGIEMADGTIYRTKEPEIDAVISVLKKCGKWGKIVYGTE